MVTFKNPPNILSNKNTCHIDSLKINRYEQHTCLHYMLSSSCNKSPSRKLFYMGFYCASKKVNRVWMGREKKIVILLDIEKKIAANEASGVWKSGKINCFWFNRRKVRYLAPGQQTTTYQTDAFCSISIVLSTCIKTIFIISSMCFNKLYLPFNKFLCTMLHFHLFKLKIWEIELKGSELDGLCSVDNLNYLMFTVWKEILYYAFHFKCEFFMNYLGQVSIRYLFHNYSIFFGSYFSVFFLITLYNKIWEKSWKPPISIQFIYCNNHQHYFIQFHTILYLN